MLTNYQEDKLADFVKGVLQVGGPLDHEGLVMLGNTVLAETSTAGDCVPELNQKWADNFRRRHRLGRLMTPTSDRPLDTPHEVELDNKWRLDLTSFIADPGTCGMVDMAPFDNLCVLVSALLLPPVVHCLHVWMRLHSVPYRVSRCLVGKRRGAFTSPRTTGR